jgi:hypothetical protein
MALAQILPNRGPYQSEPMEKLAVTLVRIASQFTWMWGCIG